MLKIRALFNQSKNFLYSNLLTKLSFGIQMQTIAEKKAFVGIMGALSSLAAYGCFWQLRRYQENSNRWNKIFEELNQFKPYDLDGLDAKFYPWYRDGNINDWEYRLVKLKGYFKEERFFVRKTRDGRVGYAVFAPFITAIEDNDVKRETDANPILEYGLMVNLGWVPIENKNDIEMGSEPIPPLVRMKFYNLSSRMPLKITILQLKIESEVKLPFPLNLIRRMGPKP